MLGGATVDGSSVDDVRLLPLIECCEAIAHRLHALGAVAGPVLEFPDHAHRLSRAGGPGGVAPEPFVRDVRILLALPGLYYDVDLPLSVSAVVLAAPGRCSLSLGDLYLAQRPVG